MEKLAALSKAGASIVFLNKLPDKHSGYNPSQESTVLLEEIKQQIRGGSLSNLKVIDLDKLSDQLVTWGNKREELALHDLDFIRKKDDSGCAYFISNFNSGKDINNYIPIATDSKEYILYNPMTGEKGKAAVKKVGDMNTVLLQLKQGQSIFLFAKSIKSNLTDWKYIGQRINKIRLSGNWNLEFMEGGPTLSKSTRINKLVSWTELPDTMAPYFSGLARYSINFSLEDFDPNNKYMIIFDKVKESVLIRLNGQQVTTLFSHPFEADISNFLKNGENHIELEVANLPANRIRYLDKQQVEWQKFYNINYISIKGSKFNASKWEPIESGLIGDVTIVCYQINQQNDK